MRKPSVHITEETLAKLLSEYFPNMKDKEITSLTSFLMRRGKTYNLSHRMIYVSNDKLLKKSEKIKAINSSDAGKFSELLIMLRRKAKHRGIIQIKPGDTEWLTVKEVTKQATEFCNEFALANKIGYSEYIKVGLGMMKNYSLNKFKSLHSAIINRFEAKQELDEDNNQELTETAYKTYIGILNEKTGLVFEDYKNNPEKYVCFKRAKDDSERIRVPIKVFIQAQFYSMEWQNRIPDPFQLYGEKAIERVRKYCAENNIKFTAEKRITFKRIPK